MNRNIERETFAGYTNVEVMDDFLGVSFPMIIMYPSETHELEEKLGPYSVMVAKGAKLKKGVFPLVILSHGTGGTPLVYRTLSRYLARHGFIVAMPEHPYNNIHDNRLEQSVALLESRPKNITQVIDWFEQDESFKDSVDFDELSIIGHSMGGYTAIAATGGVPTTLPWDTGSEEPRVVSVTRDERIRKIVLFAPALGWFREEGALDQVEVPIFMVTGAEDDITPSFHADILKNGTSRPARIEHKVIEHGGHFSFLSPFPERMKNPSFPPSQDPDGFDREAFHEELNADVLRYLRSE